MSTNALALAPTPSSTPVAPSDLSSPTATPNGKPISSAPITGTGSLGSVPQSNPGAARIGSRNTGSNDGSFTVAATPPPVARVGGWLRVLEGPPQGRPLSPGAIPTVRSPIRLIPVRPEGEGVVPGRSTESNPLLRIFSPGSRMRAAEGLPQMSGALSTDRLSSVVNPALTSERLAQFDRLQPAQQDVARGLLSAALSELQLPAWQGGLEAARNFDEVVGIILERSSQWQDLPQPATGAAPLPSPARGSNRLPEPARTGSLPNPATQPALPEGAIDTFQGTTSAGNRYTTEVYRSANMPESKIRANIGTLQQKNPYLYAGLSADELVRTARSSDYFLVTTQHGTSNLWGPNAPPSTTPERAITAITVRDFEAGQYALPQGGRYAELTFVASSKLQKGGEQVVQQAEAYARRLGLDGVAFYNTDTTRGGSRTFYTGLGYTLTREVSVDVRSLDARVQQQLIDGGEFTRAQIDRGDAELPRYYFEKRFGEPPAGATPSGSRP